MSTCLRPRLVLDRGALLHNLSEIENRARMPSGVVVMLKANAYGHGLIEVSEALAEHAIAFGVSEAADAFALLDAGCVRPLLLVGPASADEQAALLGRGVTVTIDDVDRLRLLIERRPRGPGAVDFFADTGMHRLGIAPADLPATVALAQSAGLSVRAVGIQPRSGDIGDWDDVESEVRQVQKALRGIDLARHSGGTSMALERPDLAGDQVRVGIGVFGYHPHPRQRPLASLTPALELQAPILALCRIRKGDHFSYAGIPPAATAMTLATLGIGACHGVTADLTEAGNVLVDGCPAPFVGAPTLDYAQVDVTDVPTARVGDYVTVIGGPGGSGRSVAELAARANTIPDHILMKISPRIMREVAT